MNWIKQLWLNCQDKLIKRHVEHQDKLILLICLPCLLVTGVALLSTNTSGYLIAFILICLSILCCYVIVASKKQAEYQVRTLANLIESMIDGDYSLRGRLKNNQAFQELLVLINSLSDTLAQHKIAAKESRVLLELIVDQMDAMVLAIDASGNLVMANNSAKKLLLNDVESFEGVSLNSLPLGLQLKNASPGIIQFMKSEIPATSARDSSRTVLNGEYFLYKEKFLSDGQSHQLYLLTNAERLLMEKERNAWQSLLRVLSHEINNSLTPISTIGQSIKSKLKNSLHNGVAIEPKGLIDGISIINERADSLGEFIASYSQLAHLPKPVFGKVHLHDVVNKLALLFPECEIVVDKSVDIQLVADQKQLEQVLINLFKNAVDAMSAITPQSISISCRQEQQWQQIVIVDHGCGITNFDNLFVPFYTTKSSGSGIGLALCRQIMFSHYGLINIKNRTDGQGAEVLLSLPR
jgi:nitrogen fixation/metabolism regulation signal transduction histidine kinase